MIPYPLADGKPNCTTTGLQRSGTAYRLHHGRILPDDLQSNVQHMDRPPYITDGLPESNRQRKE